MSALQCLVCGGSRVDPWFERDGRSVVRCRSCRFWWVPEGLATDADGVSVYEGDDPIFFQDGYDAYYVDEANLRSFSSKVDWLAQYLAPNARLLDVGSGFGHFLKVAAPRFAAVGCDLSPAAVAWSRKELGVANHVGSIEALPPVVGEEPFEAVTAWDVIEHLAEPDRALSRIRELLAPSGMLFLSTPDAGSLAARLLGQRWHYLDLLQHISYFGRRNLERLLLDNGFTPLQWRSFGRHYSLGYIADRLYGLYGDTVLGGGLGLVARAAQPVADWHVYLKLGDVMGVVARRA